MNNKVFDATKLLNSQLFEQCANRYLKYQNRDIVIWGTGKYGKFICNLLQCIGMHKNIKAICDSFYDDLSIDYICSIPVMSFESAVSNFNNALFIIASDYYEDIIRYVKNSSYPNIEIMDIVTENLAQEKQLIFFFDPTNLPFSVAFTYQWIEIYNKLKAEGRLDFMVNEIESMLEAQKSKDILANRIKTILSGNLSYINSNPVDRVRYFSDEFYPMSSDEVYFDCGAYNGDSIRMFMTETKGHYNKIIALEPDLKNISKLRDYIVTSKLKNIDVKVAATGNSNGKVNFSNDGIGSSKVGDTIKVNEVDLVKLDDFIEENPTLIKMDIEGAELDSLKGASLVIRTLKPKLAICIYHRPTDFYDIPKYLSTLVPEYKFKIRQHQKYFYDTVLYAYV